MNWWDSIATSADLSLRDKLSQTWLRIFDGHCTCPPHTDAHRQRQVDLLDLAFDTMAHVAHLHFGVAEGSDAQ